MPVYQSSSFGDVHGKVFAGGIQLLQTGSDGSYSIYVSATVNDNTCVLQELDLLTLQEKSTKFILSDETCPTLLPGIVSSQTNDVRSVVVLGTKIQNDGTHHGKAAVFHLDGGSFQGFTSSETMDSGAWTYPVDISYSKDFRASEILFFAPADGATVGSIEDYPTEWSPFVVAPPMASAIRIAQIHSKNYEKIVWTQEYVAHHANDPARPVPVFPAGLYTHPETEAVYVAGSTAGKGVAFGEVSGNTDDVDAFIIKLESNSEVSSARLGTAGHDYIISQCSPVEETALMEGDKFQNTDPSLAESWYVVGTTSSSFFKPSQQYIQGDGSTPVYRAFISKIDMEEMEEEWTVELAAPSETANANAAATKCVVDPATGDIYVTGSTTSLLQAETKDGPSGIQGNVDGSNAGLFLTRISSGGTVKWIQQFGSGDQSDRITGLALAPTNAVSTLSTVKDTANVLVTGHTNGDITRKGSNPTTTVLFVLSLDAATGSMLLNDVYVPSMPPPSEVPAIPPNSSPESIPDSFSDSYLGCWIDDGNDKAMDVQAPVATLSIKNCVAFCRDYKSPGDGYPYAALQNGSQCSCGFRYNKHGEAAEGDCNIQCASGPGICGGSLRISVYSTGATNPTAPPTSIPVPSPTKPPEPDPTSPPTMQPVASPTNPPEPDPTSPPIAQPGPEHTNQPESDVFYPPDIETFPPTAHADPRSDATVSRDGLAFQSNWGPSYSGAMVYDFTRHAIYLTGSTFTDPRKSRSTCFLGHLPLSNLQHWKTVTDPVSTGESDAVEDSGNMACLSLARDENFLWVGGAFEENGVERNSLQLGFYTLYTRDHRNPDWDVLHADLIKRQPEQVKVQLPEAMVILPNENQVFIASIASNDDQLTPEYYRNEDKEQYPNYTAGGDYLKRGYGYYISIQSYKIQVGRDGSYPSFDQATELQTDKDVFVSGMSLLEDRRQIVVAGSVNGKNGKNFNSDREANDMDGFVVHMELTRLMMSEALRFNSIENADDFIHNVCESPDGDSYFVVGSTYGTLPDATIYGARESPGALSAFVAKVSFESMQIVWSTQLNAKAGTTTTSPDVKAEAFGCHVIPHDETLMYVGGVVYDGASMIDSVKSAGSDDLFVAKMNTSDGTVRWLRQIGSSGKENMARNNGVFADMEGDCLLYGDTTGELYRTRHEKSTTPDIFFVKLSQEDGNFSQTLEMRRGYLAAIGIVILFILACCGFCFCAIGGRWFQRRRAPGKKDDDYMEKAGLFKDDPSIDNGSHRNGFGQYKDEEIENRNGHPKDKGAFELPVMSAKSYED